MTVSSVDVTVSALKDDHPWLSVILYEERIYQLGLF